MPFKEHYIKKKISEINPDIDLKVQVVGIVVDKKEDSVIFDDGSGKIRIFVDFSNLLDKININNLIRVFGSTLPTETGFELKADIIQDLSSLNINLYKKVDELYNRMGV